MSAKLKSHSPPDEELFQAQVNRFHHGGRANRPHRPLKIKQDENAASLKSPSSSISLTSTLLPTSTSEAVTATSPTDKFSPSVPTSDPPSSEMPWDISTWEFHIDHGTDSTPSGSSRHIQGDITSQVSSSPDVSKDKGAIEGKAISSNMDKGITIGILAAVVVLLLVIISGIAIYLYRLKRRRDPYRSSSLRKLLRSTISSSSKSSSSRRGSSKKQPEKDEHFLFLQSTRQEQSIISSDSPWLQGEAPSVFDLYVSLSRPKPVASSSILKRSPALLHRVSIPTETLQESLFRQTSELDLVNEAALSTDTSESETSYAGSAVSDLSAINVDQESSLIDTSNVYPPIPLPFITEKLQAAPQIEYQTLNRIERKEWETLLRHHPSLESLKEFVAGSDTQSYNVQENSPQRRSRSISISTVSHRLASLRSGSPSLVHKSNQGNGYSASTHSSFAPIRDYYEEVFASIP